MNKCIDCSEEIKNRCKRCDKCNKVNNALIQRERRKREYKLPKCKVCGIELKPKHQYCEIHAKQVRRDKRNTDEMKAYHKDKSAQHYVDNKEELDKKHKEWQLKNPERRNELYRIWVKKNPERSRQIQRKSNWNRFGIIPPNGDWDILFKLMDEQKNCQICGKSEDDCGQSLHLDHDHKTGKPREFLCYNCNTMIGQCDDNIDILKKAIGYLDKHNN